MDTIIIGFSRPKSWFNPFSWLIRMGEGNLLHWAPMSHAYIKYFDDYTQEWIIFQASGRMVNFISAESFEDKEVIVAEFEIPVDPQVKLATVEYAEKQLGVPYGIMHVVGMGLVVIARNFGFKMANPFSDNGRTMVCSELAAVVMENILQTDDTYDPDTAFPIDDFNFLVSKGYKRLV